MADTVKGRGLKPRPCPASAKYGCFHIRVEPHVNRPIHLTTYLERFSLGSFFCPCVTSFSIKCANLCALFNRNRRFSNNPGLFQIKEVVASGRCWSLEIQTVHLHSWVLSNIVPLMI
jgi:hypothetical protein